MRIKKMIKIREEKTMVKLKNEEKNKNVIWIFGDQHRGQALSCNGDPNVNTPNLDIMSAGGVNFTSAVSGFPLSCPFRGSLLTGKYPHQCVPGHEYQLSPEMPTIATIFNQEGYHTAYFGKWHLDGFKEAEGRAAKHYIPPERRGDFQDWIGYENNNSQWDCWVHGEKDGKEIEPYRLPGYETDELTNLLIDYIKEQGNQDEKQPFFAALSVQPPHNPYAAPAEFMENYNMNDLELRENVPDVDRIQKKARRELAGACAQIENLDWNIGRIRKALQKAGLEKDTHIIFFSDHGDMHGSHGQFRKTTAYQESISIPFIISGAQSRYEGWKTGRVNPPLNSVDIAPTTLGLCGIDQPEWMEGTDYSHYRIEKDSESIDNEPDSALLQSVIPTGHGDSVNRRWRGILTRNGWKYATFKHTPWLMFNLNEDPYEQTNLVHNNAFADKRKELQDKLKSKLTNVGDDFPVSE